MVCKNRDTAERVARAGRLDAITVEGDLVNRKGALSGGYADPTRSKIRAHAKVRRPQANGLCVRTGIVPCFLVVCTNACWFAVVVQLTN